MEYFHPNNYTVEHSGHPCIRPLTHQYPSKVPPDLPCLTKICTGCWSVIFYWRYRIRGRKQIRISPPTVYPYQLSPPSNTFAGYFRHRMMTGRRWFTISGRHERNVRSCHRCWGVRVRMLGRWDCSMLQWSRRSFCMGSICGLCPRALGGRWADSTIGWSVG